MTFYDYELLQYFAHEGSIAMILTKLREKIVLSFFLFCEDFSEFNLKKKNSPFCYGFMVVYYTLQFGPHCVVAIKQCRILKLGQAFLSHVFTVVY